MNYLSFSVGAFGLIMAGFCVTKKDWGLFWPNLGFAVFNLCMAMIP